jgi:hypothetical protein
MQIEIIETSDVLVNDSLFSMNNYIIKSREGPSCQTNSFQTLGILYPVVVYRDGNRRLHLIDGVKRMQFAKLDLQNKIKAMIFPGTTPVTVIISLIICNKRHEIESSVINKVQSVCFAISLNAPESWILNTLCFSFGFRPHSEFLRECERINNLPKEMKQFCHDKKMSLKQILNFTYYPADLLKTLLDWKSVLQLTASTLDEIAVNINDCVRREGISVEDLLSGQDIQEIMDSSLGPREKTEQLRRILHIRKFPLLSSANRRIEDAVESAGLPEEVRINWDRTLENRKIDINISINNPVKWSGILEFLRSDELKASIEKILEEL